MDFHTLCEITSKGLKTVKVQGPITIGKYKLLGRVKSASLYDIPTEDNPTPKLKVSSPPMFDIEKYLSPYEEIKSVALSTPTRNNLETIKQNFGVVWETIYTASSEHVWGKSFLITGHVKIQDKNVPIAFFRSQPGGLIAGQTMVYFPYTNTMASTLTNFEESKIKHSSRGSSTQINSVGIPFFPVKISPTETLPLFTKQGLAKMNVYKHSDTIEQKALGEI